MVREFTAAVLEIDDGPASRFVDRLRSDGVPVESIYLGLFSASARLLGEYWTTDRCPFTEVTLGLWRLHRLVRDMSHDFRNESVRGRRSLMALITTAPGEQHSFGVVMLSEWFRRAGWSLVPSPLRTNAEIARAVSRASLDVVGFSASSEASIDALSATIAAVRRTSRNRSVGVMVGGSLFNERPDLVVRVGADATACDAPEAIAKAERFAVCGDWAPH
jgi:methanogenic corrinoid protein MtbC1